VNNLSSLLFTKLCFAQKGTSENNLSKLQFGKESAIINQYSDSSLDLLKAQKKLKLKQIELEKGLRS